MEKPTIFKSVKTVFTSIKSIVSETQKQFEKLVESFGGKQVLQPQFVKVKENQKAIFGFVLFMCFSFVNAQTGTAFSARLKDGSVKVKGDIILIGNTVINKVKDRAKPFPSGKDENPADFSPAKPVNGVKYTGSVTNLAALTTEANTAFDGNGNNNDFYVEYSDVDNDPDTFNSTMAKLTINNSCKNIVFAGLYWSAIYPYERSTSTGAKYEGSLREEDWNTVKFKMPNGAYEVITASKTDTREVIFDGYKKNGSKVEDSFKDSPYVCFKDVTKKLQDLPDANGDYYVANVRAARGKRNGGGAGGWTLVVIYESPSLPSKFISVFDGYVGVDPGTQKDKTVDYTVSGFQTLPVGFPVIAKIGIAALEGDNQLDGDSFSIKANSKTTFTKLKDAVNPENNFFNATISSNGLHNLDRNPQSKNTMGFDIDHILLQNDVNGVKNAVIPNGETGATLRLTTDGDGYGAFVTTFAVDVIEPKIVLTKIVKGVRTNATTGLREEYDLAGQPVTLGQEMIYEIGFNNQGNDNAKDFTITDVIPQNVIFNSASDIIYKDAGIDLVSYTPATRTLVFKVSDALVKKDGSKYKLQFRVKVVTDCNELVDACSNIIKNTATSRYFGDINPTNNGQPYGDGSYSFNTGCIVGDPTSTNFLVGIEDCLFNRAVSLCGSAILKAANGYKTWVWTDASGNVIGNTQQITVTKAGVYKVQTGGNPDCKGILQTYTVTDYAVGANDNPISTYADNIDPATGRPYLCTNDKKEFPKIFLCGLNDTRFIDTHITAADSTVKWQVTTDVPPTGFPASCAYEDAVNWTSAGPDGPTFTANKSGSYRVVVSYGNNCQNIFYFSVFQNPLKIEYDKRDEICNTAGRITITNPQPGTGYTYSKDGTNFQTSNVFDNLPTGDYTIHVKQTAATTETSSCPFTVKVTILKANFQTTVTPKDAFCAGNGGSIYASADNVRSDYQFIVTDVATGLVKADSGKITFPNYKEFTGLAPGTYDVTVSTSDGCTETKRVTINDKTLKATADITKTLACGNGEITIKASGGTPIPPVTTPGRYYYSVNGIDYGTNPVIPVTTAGDYKIVVTDYNSCSITLETIKITAVAKPVVKFTPHDAKCYGESNGYIDVSITPANSGYAIEYSIDGGTNYSSVAPITNLAKGNYDIIVKYTYGGIDCIDPAVRVVIDEPSTALTASAGVSELAGCDPSGNGFGKLRITNPQGGLAPYNYSFDGGATWQPENEKYVAAGTYNLYIKDKNECTFLMEGIVLDKEPVAPSISVETPVDFNCDGTATSTVIVDNPGPANYNYKYYIDGSTTPNTNVPPNVFLNVPPGKHDIRVEYALLTVPTFSNLLNEDFGIGFNTKSPGIAAAYCYHDLDLPSTCSDTRGTLEDNQYVVTRQIEPNNSAWYPFRDHTSNGTNRFGRFLAVNIGGAAGPNGVLYSKQINDVIPGQPVIVEAYLANLFRANFVGGVDPSFAFELVDTNGNVIAQAPAIPPTPNPTGIPPIPTILRSNKWEKREVTLNPGNNTTLIFRVRSGSTEYSGNDGAIDDIKVYQLPKSCIKEKLLTIVVPTGKAFTGTADVTKDVSCGGTGAPNDGEITITATNFDTAYGYDYTIDGGANWVNVKVSPYIVKDLAAKTYDVRVRYNATTESTCTKTFTPTIKAPQALIAGGVVHIPAKCSVGATIRASASEGTPAYEYELRHADGTVYKPFQSNTDFTDIPEGDYEVFVRDANKCVSAVGAPVKVVAPPAISAALDINSDFCYDTANKASVTVIVTGGTGPFSYSIDGKPAQTPSNVFNNIEPGDHTIIVIDAVGCSPDPIDFRIERELSVDKGIKTLDCSPTTGNAVVTGTISYGYPPYTVSLVSGNTTGTLVQPTTPSGTTFTYTTGIADTYIFEVKDSKGCVKQMTAVVDAITNPSLREVSKVPVSCNGLSDGSVVLAAQNGSGGYRYSSDNITFTNTTGIFSGLSAGLHTFYVRDNKGCSGQIDVTITAPAALQGSASITIVYNCDHAATITATANGGNGTYTFVLKRGTTTVATNTTGIFSGLTVAGTYSVDITDGKLCPLTVSVADPIVALTPPTAMTFSNTALKCPANTVDVTIETVTGGKGTMATFQYRIALPTASQTVFQPSPTFAGLAPGTYTFEVKDENNCTKQVPYTIDKLPALSISSNVDNTVICKGASTGIITFTITGFGNNTPYSYIVDGDTANIVTGTTPGTGTTFDIIVPNLNAGNHTIEVTNGTTNCKVSRTQHVAEPLDPLALTPATLTPKTCNDLGTATIHVTGGWNTNYTYTVTPPTGPAIVQENNNYFVNLENGLYNYTVKDLKGCEVNGTFTIILGPDVTASIAATTNLCYTNAGKAAIYVTPNTQANYTYSLNGATPQGNGTFENLEPGKYVITVRDTSTGCFVDLTEQTVTTELTASTTLSAGPRCDTSDVVITGKVSGGTAGTAGYTYVVSIDGTLESPATMHTIPAADNGVFTYTDSSGIPAGKTTPTVYVFTFTDAATNGCTTTATRTVQPKTDPQFTATPNSTILCSGQESGSITVTINTAFGQGPYVIDVHNTTTNTSYGTQTTGLPAGNYTVRVTDLKGCFAQQINVIITQPDPVVVTYDVQPITCQANGVSLGSITIQSVDGGVKNYTYNVKGINYDRTFSNQDGGTQVFEVVNFGYYEIRVTDANGCLTLIDKILVASPPDDLDITVTNPPLDCSTGGSAIVSIGSSATGGTITGNGPFYFAIYDGSVPNYPNPVGSFAWLPEDNPGTPGDKKATFTNLTPGVKYTFIVYDSDAAHGGTGTGCYYFETAEDEIPTNSQLKIEGDPESHNITCFTTPATVDGNVSFKISSTYAVPTDVDYQILNELTLQPMGPVQSGIVPAATVPVSTLDINNFGALPFGKYIIVVTEIKDRTTTPVTKGCSIASIPFTITGSVTPLTITASSPKNANCNPNQGKIEAFAQGGTTLVADPDPTNPKPAVPYLYQIFPDNGPIGEDATDTRPTAASFDLALHKVSVFNREAGNYLVYVRDAYGCIQVATVTVLQDPSPVITAVPALQCTAAQGGFGITVNLTTLGVGPYTYSLDGGDFEEEAATTFTIPNVSSGTHTVRVKDSNGCGNTVSNITIYAPLEIEGSFTTPPTCRTADGTITVSVKGGFRTPTNFEYTLVNNTTGVTSPVQANNPVFINQAAGNYTVTVRDINTGCAKPVTIDLAIPADPDFTLSNTAPNCVTSQGTLDNGTITVTLPTTNTDIPYKYTLTKISPAPLGLPVTQNTKVFTGLTAGVYEVTVSSAKGCAITKQTEIFAPTPVTIALSQDDFKCTGTAFNEKTVTITPGGGAGAVPVVLSEYKYSANGTTWQDENTFSVSDNGFPKTLTYYVKDAKGCIVSAPITIQPFPKLVSAVAAKINPVMDCINNRQDIEVIITGGTNAFTYQAYRDGVAEGGLVPVTNDRFTYGATTPGSNYHFEIFDNNTTCSILSNTIEVPVFDTLEVFATAAANVDCNGNSTGAIEINITGYAGPYTYEILKGGVALTPPLTGTGDSTTSSSFVLPHGLAAGNDYTVRVVETAYPSCDFTTTIPVIITEPAPLTGFSVINENKNCFNTGSKVTIDLTTISGGSGGNTYAFVQDNVSPNGHYGPDSFAILDPATNTEWDVWVKDKNDCAIKLDVTIAEDVSPSNLTVNSYSQCPSPTGTYTFTVTATTAGGAEYSIGNGFQPTGTFTVDAPGDYFVTVRDKNGCTNAVPFKVEILEKLSVSTSISVIPTCNDANGEITLHPLGGSGNYEYSIDGTNFGSNPVFANLAPAAYTFYVRDTTTGCPAQVGETIERATTITGFALTATPVTCAGFSDGTITATMTTPSAGVNDNPKYRYSIDGGANYQESNIFTGLATGHYVITVISGRGCVETEEIDVNTPLPINVPAPAFTQFNCNTGSNASNFATITVSGVTGGSNTYANYEFIKVGTPNTVVYFGSNPVYTIHDLTGGTYIVNVYDNKGCVGTAPAPIVINPYIALDKISVNVDRAITCNNLEDITVSISSIGGTPVNLEYSVVDIDASTGALGTLYPLQTNTTGVFTGLPVANYLVTVTNLDTHCSVEYIHYVNEPNTFDLKIENVQNVTCFAGNNGSIDVTIVDLLIKTNPVNPDSAGPFDYVIRDASNTIVRTGSSSTAGPTTISGLSSGVYSITGTLLKTPFCQATKNFTIAQPAAALAVTATKKEITCIAGNNDGKIIASATGGWPGGYKYELRIGTTIITPYQDSSNFENLTEGNYTVFVTDSRGCEASINVPLVNPTPIAVSIGVDKTLLLCYDDQNATITVNTVSGGSGNYTYTLRGTLADGTEIFRDAQPDIIFSGLGAGTYQITASDDWTCSNVSNTVTVTQPEVVKASLSVNRTETCAITPQVILTATGGTAPYYYSVDGITYNPTSFNSTVVIDLPKTTGDVSYKYYVRDVNGCLSIESNEVPFSPVPAIVLETLNHTDIQCTGDVKGSITAIAKGGLGNFVYILTDISGNPITPAPTQLYPGEFTDLAVGSYRVRVESLDCSLPSEIIQITEPAQALTATLVPINVTCSGFNNGKITVNAVGGTGRYVYAIAPNFEQFFDTNVFENLRPGLYTIRVQDENGCFQDYEQEIIQPDPIEITEDVTFRQEEHCAGDNDGQFAIDIIGGTLPYSYSLDKQNGPFTVGTAAQTRFEFTNLLGGTHIVYIVDANQCSQEITIDMALPVKLDPKVEVTYDCVNNAQANMVVVTIDPSNTDPTQVTYSLDNDGTFHSSNIFTNVAAGPHFMVVKHANGCEVTTEMFEVNAVDPLALIDVTNQSKDINTLEVKASGGVAPYEYSFNGESFTSSNTYRIYKTGDYQVIVRDKNGCEATITVHGIFYDFCMPNYFTPNGDGQNDTIGPDCGALAYKELTFDIYDRYGRVVAKYHVGQKWDGRYHGSELPTGDYWYVLKLNDPKDNREFVGHFTLYR